MPETPETTPEQWHLPPPEVVEPKRISPLLVPVLGLIAAWFPRRLGPHLAGMSWLAALVAAFLNCTVASMVNRAVGGWYNSDEQVWTDRPQLLFYKVNWSDVPGWIALELGPSAWTGLRLVVFFLLASLLFWPVLTVGEHWRIRAARAGKLLLWSSSALVWITLLHPVLFEPSWLQERANPWQPWRVIWVRTAVFRSSLMLVYLTWWLSVVARLGWRYSGPPRGRRWDPIEPACESCNYRLTGMPLDARCPECGRAVRDSLPTYRQPPAYGQRGGILAFWQTVWAALTQRDFCGTCAIWKQRRASDAFFYWCCLLSGVAVTGLLSIRAAFVPDPIGIGASFWTIGMFVPRGTYTWLYQSIELEDAVLQQLLLPVFLGLITSLLLLLLGWGERFSQSFLLRKQALHNAVLMNYMFAWLLVTIVVTGCTLLIADQIAYWNRPWAWFYVRGLGSMHSEVLVYLLGLAPAGAILMFGGFHLLRQIKMARYANG